MSDVGAWLRRLALERYAKAFADNDIDWSLLAEGEGVIARGCLAHGALAFYRDAIDTCLELSDPDGADRYARALRQFPRDESLPYSRFHSARGAALAAVARGSADPDLRACLAGLRDQALAAGVVRYVPPIEQGLQRRKQDMAHLHGLRLHL